jgi:hypothetical protein
MASVAGTGTARQSSSHLVDDVPEPEGVLILACQCAVIYEVVWVEKGCCFAGRLLIAAAVPHVKKLTGVPDVWSVRRRVRAPDGFALRPEALQARDGSNPRYRRQ